MLGFFYSNVTECIVQAATYFHTGKYVRIGESVKFCHQLKFAEPFVQALERTPPPSLLYHYTDDKGLRGILESGKLWLTDIFHLNDPAELRYGLSHAVDALRLSAEDSLPERGVFTKRFRELQDEGIKESGHYFVASFGGTADDLGQWRMYADDGKGYALAFDGAMLARAFTESSGVPIPSNMTFPVSYDDQTLRRLQSQIVALFLPCISAPRGKNLPSAVVNEYMTELSVAFSAATIRASLFFKHPAYRNEQEFRFMQIQQGHLPARGVLYRSRPYALVKYVEFDWKTVAAPALKEIVVGPAADRSMALPFANECLKAFFGNDRGGVKVWPSSIPYRSLPK
jgi:hypothetical protein